MQAIFANTGVQLLCFPFRLSRPLTLEQTGNGWQYCVCQAGSSPREIPYIQWQIVEDDHDQTTKLFLAVDTTTGDEQLGHCKDLAAFTAPLVVSLDGLMTADRRSSLPLDPVPGFRIEPTGMGEPKPVDLVVDFGNSRTGCLLLEKQGDAVYRPIMLPFEPINRYRLLGWDEKGTYTRTDSARWFTSRTQWCTPPYRPPLTREVTEYVSIPQTFMDRLRGRERSQEVKKAATPALFGDLSMVRMGPEAEDVTRVIRLEGEQRTGVSSPKRYLWADDDSWLDGSFWFMADPYDHVNTTEQHGAPLQGPLLRYLGEHDRDDILESETFDPARASLEAPAQPSHPPRILMVAALYELICQAYTFINSHAYRETTGDPSRPRYLRSLTLTYPSGMIQQERDRFLAQAKKAVRVFHWTLGKQQQEPSVTFGLDEASAVHLVYIWSEMQLLGGNARKWFSLVGRRQGESPDAALSGAQERGSAERIKPGAPRSAPPRSAPPRSALPRSRAPLDAGPRELCMACIDIGGGTTDLMVGKYRDQALGGAYAIEGTILYRDSIFVAGDQLIKRLLERVILPSFANAAGVEREIADKAFGQEDRFNRRHRAARVRHVNRIFVPLAQAYLEAAVRDDESAVISQNDANIVAPEELDLLERTLVAMRREEGFYNVRADMDLHYDKDKLDHLVYEVFYQLLFDFSREIAKHDVDLVLLAGQPAKLNAILELVQTFLPLPPSRIISLHGHYAGAWYPYHDEFNRGIISDPKSAVVVGASIFFQTSWNMINLKFSMQDRAGEESYYWGPLTRELIHNDHLMFSPGSPDSYRFQPTQDRMLLGRKLSDAPEGQATPVYLLKIDNPSGGIDVSVTLRRQRNRGTRQEELILERVEGKIGGQPAIKDQNVRLGWRTLADERYFLDSGGLDNIALDDILLRMTQNDE